MNLNQPTLVQFENIRKLSNTIPPEGSNSFYVIGRGRINLATLRANPEDPRFDITIQQGNVHTGDGNFLISGDNHNPETPYNAMIIDGVDPTLYVDKQLTISNGSMEVHKSLELVPGSELIVRNNGIVNFHQDSVFTINENTHITIEPGSTIRIFGRIIVDLSRVDALLDLEGDRKSVV